MRNVYAFESEKDFKKYEDVIQRFSKKLEKYRTILEEQFQLKDLPKGIIWTSAELATAFFSDVPLPAYTNENFIYFSPDLDHWKNLFLKQLKGRKHPRVEEFYKTMSENHLFSILAHELTHHSDLFLDDFADEREDGIWFEEGMCDYLSRKHTLTEA